MIIASSKSGKLTTSLYCKFLKTCLKPYVGQEKFLLLIDSWSGQTNGDLYDQTFTDAQNLPTCTVKVIPPKCTPLLQPCDVYFYRQVKNLIKRIQTCAQLIQENREVNSREDCIKIHSIILHQLSAPVFNQMIQFAWFASGLSDQREEFLNVNQVCFSSESLRNSCQCENSSFIVCSWCRKPYCFTCFYDNFHSGSCVS